MFVPLLSCSDAGNGSRAGVDGISIADKNPNLVSPVKIDNQRSISLCDALSEIAEYNSPGNIPSDLIGGLKSELANALTRQFGILKLIASVPKGNSGYITDLAYISSTDSVEFTYRNTGDYDCNGEVSVSDITPIAQHYLHKKNGGNFPDSADAFIDGDNDGEIGVSDITPIAENYLARIDGWQVYTCDRIERGFIPSFEFDIGSIGDGFPKIVSAHVPEDVGSHMIARPFIGNGDSRVYGVFGNAIDAQDNKMPVGYPRLGMWYPDFGRNTVAECARYDVVIMGAATYLNWNEAEGYFSTALRAVNPEITILNYTAFSEIDYGPNDNEEYNPWLKDWPDEWFLTEAGTTLASDIDGTQTEIVVTDWTKSGPAMEGMPTTWEIFHVDGDILCEGEIMTVTGVDEGTNTLTVERAKYGRAGGAHAAGSRIAPIVRFWPGTLMMNLTSDCPTAQLHGATAPETYAKYYFRKCREGAEWFDNYNGDWDGFLFDRMEDDESWLMWGDSNSVDVNRDNVADEFEDFDAVWLQGIKDITTMVKGAFPSAPILRNLGSGRRFSDYNGNHFETWPRFGWDEWPGRATGWHWEMLGVDEDFPIEWADIFGGVTEWAYESPEPNFTWIETYEDEDSPDSDGGGDYDNPFDKPGFVPDYQKMRWGLTSALLCGAYFSYEINTNGHGSLGLMWFDEYDNVGAGRHWLGYPVGDMIRLYTEAGTGDGVGMDVSVWGREYTNGYVVCNPLEHAQTVDLPTGVWMRINGTQASTVNDGAVVEGAMTVPSCDGIVLRRG